MKTAPENSDQKGDVWSNPEYQQPELVIDEEGGHDAQAASGKKPSQAKNAQRLWIGAGITAMLVILAIVLLLVFLVFDSNDTPPPEFQRFGSCSEFDSVMRQHLQTDDEGGYFFSPWFYSFCQSCSAYGGCFYAFAQEDAAAVSGGDDGGSSITTTEGSPDFSETNVQVEGVDEPDIVKTDGTYIYILGRNVTYNSYASAREDNQEYYNYYYSNMDESTCGTVLSIIRASDDTVMSSTLLHREVVQPKDMMLSADRLLILGDQLSENVDPSISTPHWLLLMTLDISDRTKPMVMRLTSVEGSYMTSRMINSVVFFSLRTFVYDEGFIRPPYTKSLTFPDDHVALHNVSSVVSTHSPAVRLAECDRIGYVSHTRLQALVTVGSLSLEPGHEFDDVQSDTVAMAGFGHAVYSSFENYYLASGSGWFRNNGWETSILRFAISPETGSVEYGGLGWVSGHVLNQFSMDEYENHIRIATTTFDDEPKSNVFVLSIGDTAEGIMPQVGASEDLAPTETIRSVRFVGPMAYVVTFRQVDPLFVLDVSSPTNPIVLGELKITGFSQYLHPINVTHLVGIGVDGTEDGRITGIKISMFDVSVHSDPRQVLVTTIGMAGSSSVVFDDHRGFLFDAEKNLMALPVTVTGDSYNILFQGAHVFSLDDNGTGGFSRLGQVTHIPEGYVDMLEDANDGSYYFWRDGVYYDSTFVVRRVLYIGDVLYTISGSYVYKNSLGDMSDLGHVQVSGVN